MKKKPKELLVADKVRFDDEVGYMARRKEYYLIKATVAINHAECLLTVKQGFKLIHELQGTPTLPSDLPRSRLVRESFECLRPDDLSSSSSSSSSISGKTICCLLSGTLWTVVSIR